MKSARSLVCCVVFVVLVLARVQAQDQPKGEHKETAVDKAKKAEAKAQAKPKDVEKEIAADNAKKKAEVKDQAKPKDAQKEIAADNAKKKAEAKDQAKPKDAQKEIAATIARRKARSAGMRKKSEQQKAVIEQARAQMFAQMDSITANTNARSAALHRMIAESYNKFYCPACYYRTGKKILTTPMSSGKRICSICNAVLVP